MTLKPVIDNAPVNAFLEHTMSLTYKKYAPFQETFTKIGILPFPVATHESSLQFLARSIVGQQLSVKAARSIWSRVENLADSKNKTVVDILIDDNKEDIRRCGISGNKTKALLSLKQYYQDNNLEDKYLSSLNYEERSKELQNIWGIGQWSCDMISIFYFYDFDVWPLGDVGVQRGLQKILNTNKLDQAEMVRIGNKFKPYRSILSLYAWHVLDTKDII